VTDEKKILMIVSAADALEMADGSSHPTGFWAEELAIPHQLFTEAGYTVDVATPGGKAPTVDAVSLDPANVGGEEEAERIKRALDAVDLTAPLTLADVDASAYAAIFLPGGHGPMADLATDADLGRLLVAADERGQLIAPLCHGPAGLLSATREDGTFAFAGRKLTVFTDEEELGGGTGENTPWFVEARLRELGAVVEAGPAWSSTVVVDRNLVSGQNPQSSAEAAKAVLAQVQERAAA
jgi:putative intracellular protease/amidase